MYNTKKFNLALDTYKMREIFDKYNVTAKDMKPWDEYLDSYMCKRGDLTFIYPEIK